MEDFYTIQGEGFHAGEAAYFIRLAGCDVGCVWCDVKESWDENSHPVAEVDDILKRALDYPARTVVVTGGEPLLYDLTSLTDAFKHAGYKTCLETSGACPLTGTWDWICVSPKKFKAPLPAVLEKANELKVVIFNTSDFDWAEKHSKLVNTSCMLFLQPEYSVFNKVMPLIVDYVKSFPQWKISVQMHKVISVP